MKIHNHLPLLLECLARWESCPNEKTFKTEYAKPLSKSTHRFFDDFHEVLVDLNWNEYREHALKINPANEEQQLIKNIKLVEDLFGFSLPGEIFLLGTFMYMDGFARFDRGEHRVYLGVDESHHDRSYLDILTNHELTHVAREYRPEVWMGFGMNPKMERSEYLENFPVIEHLLGEGFSCAVSEILIPGQAPWKYVYQTEKSLKNVYARALEIDRLIHQEIPHPDGDYGNFYGIDPLFSHYVWAWQWVKKVLNKYENDPSKLVAVSSNELITDALGFSLKL